MIQEDSRIIAFKMGVERKEIGGFYKLATRNSAEKQNIFDGYRVTEKEFEELWAKEKPLEYFKYASPEWELWADVKLNLPLKVIQEATNLKELDLKEIWKSLNQKDNRYSLEEKKQYVKQKDFEKKQKEKNPEFNFETLKIKGDFKNLESVAEIVKSNFPSVWFETVACLSASATLSLKNLNGCPSLNLVGRPSGEKTTVLSFFYGHDNTYISDDFSPRAFVSHSANVKKEELEAVDLLPRIRNKILITPELAPLFEAPKDKLIDNFATLTRVLDGEGLNSDKGTHGHRGYSGDYKFIWLGATTPLRASVWNVMGKIGNRLFFLNVREKNRTIKDYLEMFSGKAYEEKVKICRSVVRKFLDNHFLNNPVRSIEWDAEQDLFILQEIIKYATLLSKLRGTLMLWKDEVGQYQYNFPLIEEPPRAINSLYNLAKGHALINGRKFLRTEDLEIVRAVAFSSMPHDRSEFLKILSKHEGRLTTQNIQQELNCSGDTARRTMELFKILGVVSLKNLDFSGGRPMYYVEINSEFAELLKHTQVLNGAEKDKPQESKGEGEPISTENFLKYLKNNEKIGHSHPISNAEKDKPQEINHMFEHKEVQDEN